MRLQQPTPLSPPSERKANKRVKTIFCADFPTNRAVVLTDSLYIVHFIIFLQEVAGGLGGGAGEGLDRDSLIVQSHDLIG